MEAKTPEDSEADEETGTSGQGNGVAGGASGDDGSGAAARDTVAGGASGDDGSGAAARDALAGGASGDDGLGAAARDAVAA